MTKKSKQLPILETTVLAESQLPDVGESSIEWSDPKPPLMQRQSIKGAIVAAPIAFLLAFVVFIFSPLAAPIFPWSPSAPANVSGQTLGQVALTEAELIEIIRRENLVAFWLGPVQGARYTLNVTAGSQVFIRYLPNGQGLEDISQSFVIVGTYPQANAYSITEAAGAQPNGVTFLNADGAMVYYSKLMPTNVYLAFPNLDYEIEIFDPVDGGALSSAATVGKVQKVQ
jgi:hypothetical protein